MSADHIRVRELLGREPRGRYDVAVHDDDGDPVVLRNAPLLDDGTPMPTRYWLVGPKEHLLVSRLESAGGVQRAEREVDVDELAAAHARYAAERDAALPDGHTGPVPSGGVGGTRQGVKCLHAHYAWFLAGGDDPVGRWVHVQLETTSLRPSGPVAAVDIGSTSTNLLIADPDGYPLERVVAITRLGAGLYPAHVLDSEAVGRTLAQLAQYRVLCDRHGVHQMRAVATAAVRDASDGDDFLAAATAILGAKPDVLSGDEEGRLAFAGATRGLGAVVPDCSPPFLVIDIGGGSTELMFGTDHAQHVVSIDVGAVRLTETILHGDPPRPEELTNAIGVVRDHLDDALRILPDFRDEVCVVGIAGTVVTVAAVELGLATFDDATLNGFVLTRDAVEDVFRTLATEPLADRVHNPGLPPERAEVIVGGCCVLVGVMRHLELPAMVVSTRSLLDGLVAESATNRTVLR